MMTPVALAQWHWDGETMRSLLPLLVLATAMQAIMSVNCVLGV
jgi:hypothetical protein